MAIRTKKYFRDKFVTGYEITETDWLDLIDTLSSVSDIPLALIKATIQQIIEGTDDISYLTTRLTRLLIDYYNGEGVIARFETTDTFTSGTIVYVENGTISTTTTNGNLLPKGIVISQDTESVVVKFQGEAIITSPLHSYTTGQNLYLLQNNLSGFAYTITSVVPTGSGILLGTIVFTTASTYTIDVKFNSFNALEIASNSDMMDFTSDTKAVSPLKMEYGLRNRVTRIRATTNYSEDDIATPTGNSSPYNTLGARSSGGLRPPIGVVNNAFNNNSFGNVTIKGHYNITPGDRNWVGSFSPAGLSAYSPVYCCDSDSVYKLSTNKNDLSDEQKKSSGSAIVGWWIKVNSDGVRQLLVLDFEHYDLHATETTIEEKSGAELCWQTNTEEELNTFGYQKELLANRKPLRYIFPGILYTSDDTSSNYRLPDGELGDQFKLTGIYNSEKIRAFGATYISGITCLVAILSRKATIGGIGHFNASYNSTNTLGQNNFSISSIRAVWEVSNSTNPIKVRTSIESSGYERTYVNANNLLDLSQIHSGTVTEFGDIFATGSSNTSVLTTSAKNSIRPTGQTGDNYEVICLWLQYKTSNNSSYNTQFPSGSRKIRLFVQFADYTFPTLSSTITLIAS